MHLMDGRVIQARPCPVGGERLDVETNAGRHLTAGIYQYAENGYVKDIVGSD